MVSSVLIFNRKSCTTGEKKKKKGKRKKKKRNIFLRIGTALKLLVKVFMVGCYNRILNLLGIKSSVLDSR